MSEAWAISHWIKGVYLDSIRATRREAIEYFRENYDPDELWKPCSRFDPNRAVKIVISPQPGDTP